MTEPERKAYLGYVFNNDLNPEERAAYREYLADVEDEFGCDASVIPIEILKKANREEINELFEKKMEERGRGDAESA